MKNATKIAQMSQVYKTMCKWSHFNPICTKMFRGIFTQSFDAFWGHSKILKIKRKAVSATGSSTKQPIILSSYFDTMTHGKHKRLVQKKQSSLCWNESSDEFNFNFTKFSSLWLRITTNLNPWFCFALHSQSLSQTISLWRRDPI